MFDYNHYVPTIKWKRGERTALEKLTADKKRKITPLIEIQPIPYDYKISAFSKTLDEHLENIGEQIKVAWNVESPIFIDVDTIYENSDSSEELIKKSIHPVAYVIDEIEKNNIPAIPVTGVYRYETFHNSVKSMLLKYNRGVCFRLGEEELADLQSLKSTLDQLLQGYEIEPANVDLILDYRQILPSKVDSHTNNLILLLAQFPYINEWRALTLLSTSYPKTLQQIPTSSNGELPRTEWLIYKKLLNMSLSRKPSFGDYNITHPDFKDLDPRLINMAAGIRYTFNDKFYIFRGVGVKNNGFSQMTKICQDVVSHSCYRGHTFSFGDKEIFDCANQSRPSTGNAETWVIAGINHHLTVVIEDISNLPFSSTVGLLET